MASFFSIELTAEDDKSSAFICTGYSFAYCHRSHGTLLKVVCAPSKCRLLRKTRRNLSPPFQPCSHPCPLSVLSLTACIQTNTRCMLIMPVRDISKISPPILPKHLSIQHGCQLLHPSPLGPIQHRAMALSVQIL